MRITLTPDEIRFADSIAEKRNTENRKVGRKDGKVLKNSIDIDKQGARSELAVSKAMNLKWDGAFLSDELWQVWRNTGHDVQNLEVRSTRHKTGRLLLHPGDSDESPFILVIASEDPTFELIGWYFGKDGKKDEWWADVGYGRPCYFVPRTEMRAIDSLKMNDPAEQISSTT